MDDVRTRSAVTRAGGPSAGRPATFDLVVDPGRAAVVLGLAIAVLTVAGATVELLAVARVPVPGLDLLVRPLQQLLGTGEELPVVWVALALPLVAVFALAYVRFLLALPRRTALGLLVAGALYVGGAAGVELVGGLVWSTAGRDTVLYTLVTTAEESLEMLGAALLVVVLAGYRRGVRSADGL